MILNLETVSSWAVNTLKVNNLQKSRFLNLWEVRAEMVLVKTVQHL